MQRVRRSKGFAARRRLGSTRPILILFCLIVIGWLLPVGVKQQTQEILFAFQAPLWRGVAAIHDVYLYWHLKSQPKDDLIQAVRDLARENAALRLQNQQDSLAMGRLQQVENWLNLPASPAFEYRVARVLRRDWSIWWDRLMLGLGESDGLAVGLGVVCLAGVVGRIVSVTPHTATVELITSPLFRMAAMFEQDERPLTYQGLVSDHFRAPEGQVMNVAADIEIQQTPKRLVTSRLGGVFPDGLTIGWVHQVKKQSDGLFQSGLVRLPDVLIALNEVAVLIPKTIDSF